LMRNVFVVVLALLGSAVLLADEVQTTDGHRYHGRVKSSDGKSVVLGSKYGTLTFPWTDVERLTYEPARVVLLTIGGRRVKATLRAETRAEYLVEVNGTPGNVRRSEVAAVKDVTHLVEATRQAFEKTAESLEKLARELEKSGLRREWRRALEALHSVAPSNDYAGRALGYVKSGDVWVKPEFPTGSVDFHGTRGLRVEAPPLVVTSGADAASTYRLVRAMLWVLPRVKHVLCADDRKVSRLEVVLYRDVESYNKLTGRDGLGHFERGSGRISLSAGDGMLRVAYWLLAHALVERLLKLGPKVEDGKVTDPGMPRWLREGLALYVQGWTLPFERGVTSSMDDYTNLGVPKHLAGSLKADLIKGCYCEPRPLTRVPESELDRRCLLCSWATVFCMQHGDKRLRDGYRRMMAAIAGGKRAASDYFDPFFSEEVLRAGVKNVYMRTARYRGRTARRGTHKIQYLWHEEGLALLKARRLAAAVDKYEAILRVAPKDRVALYNLACAHALSGDRDNAAQYLLKAWEAGFRDVEHIKNDPDLESIRDTDIFKAMTGRKREF